jgi:uncharacterized membrane protein
MPLLDKRIEVHAPPLAVFEFLGHVERLPRWMPGELRAARITEQPGKGAVVHRETEACGTRLSWDAVIEDWVPGKRLAWRQLHGDWTRNLGAWELERRGDATLVRLRVDLELPHALEREVTREEADHELSRSLDEALINLKQQLEGWD